MYESKGNDAVVFPQQAVAGEQCFGEPTDAVNEVLLALAVVVQVDLDVGDSMRRHALQRFHKVGSIFLLGIEECITGRTARRILKLCRNGRPTGGPSSDTLCPGILAGTMPERLIVIGKEKPEPLSGLPPERGKPILDIAWEPDLAVSRQCHYLVLCLSKMQVEYPIPGCVCERVRNSMKKKSYDFGKCKRVRKDMILKNLGELIVVIAGTALKTAKIGEDWIKSSTGLST